MRTEALRFGTRQGIGRAQVVSAICDAPAKLPLARSIPAMFQGVAGRAHTPAPVPSPPKPCVCPPPPHALAVTGYLSRAHGNCPARASRSLCVCLPLHPRVACVPMYHVPVRRVLRNLGLTSLLRRGAPRSPRSSISRDTKHPGHGNAGPHVGGGKLPHGTQLLGVRCYLGGILLHEATWAVASEGRGAGGPAGVGSTPLWFLFQSCGRTKAHAFPNIGVL